MINFKSMMSAAQRLTENSEPACHSAVHFVQNENDHQVYDGRGGFNRQPDVGAGHGVWAHSQSGFGWDPVQNHTKYNSKCHTNL